jgi:hypothetical protein
MHRRYLTIALAALFAAACDSSTDPNLISEQELTEDLAAASGDAIVTEIVDLVGNEAFSGLSTLMASDPADVEVVRTRTCYDAAHVAQTVCDANTTASIELTVSKNGSFSREHTGPRGTETMTAAVHQARSLVISGLAGDETSRTHNGNGTSRDTVTFSGTFENVTWTRRIAAASDDTVSNIVFNLPHSSNPWPASGTIIRNASGTVDVTRETDSGERAETFSWDRRVQVTFPADAQGNVSIQINDRTCNLNLVNRRITNCS